MDELYESKISVKRWIVYEILGNAGWIAYFVCVWQLLYRGVTLFAVLSVLPAVLMLVGLVELISERIARRETIAKKFKPFMTAFYLVMLAALLLIIGAWNHVSDFKTAYGQALLFLEVMNVYDGIAIDKLWVGCSKFWVIPGLEDLPYVQTWGQMLKKRVKLALVWVAGAALAAGLVVLIF